MKNRKLILFQQALAALGIMAFVSLDSARANPNYSPDTAQPLALNAYTSQFQITLPAENDFYRVDFPSLGTFTVQSEGTTDTFATLQDAIGFVVASNDDINPGVNNNFRITFEVGPGRYYVRVRHYSPTGTGWYSLRTTFTPGPPDDHGNTMATATLINPLPAHAGIDITVSLTARIQYGGDVDWFRINVPQVYGGLGVMGGNVQPHGYLLSVTSSGTTDVVGHLYDSAGRELTYNDDSPEYGTKNFSVGINLGWPYSNLPAGTYYLKVHHVAARSGTGTYGLTFFLGPDDHGDTMLNASFVDFLNYSATYYSPNGAGSIRPGDKDFLKVEVSGSGFLKVRCSTPYDLVGHLYDATGRELASAHEYNGTRGNFILRIPVTQGSYYLKLHHFSSTGTGMGEHVAYDYGVIFYHEH